MCEAIGGGKLHAGNFGCNGSGDKRFSHHAAALKSRSSHLGPATSWIASGRPSAKYPVWIEIVGSPV